MVITYEDDLMAHANYNGNREDMVGLVVGPDLHGALYEVIGVSYDADTDKSRVEFKPVSPTDERPAQYDQFGQLRLVEDAG